MEMVRMTEAELQQGFRALVDRARRERVTITTPDNTTSSSRPRKMHASNGAIDASGLPGSFPEDWVEAVRNAKVPDEFAALDAELK